MNTNILKQFGLNVRQKREAMGISQEKLAEIAELHRTYIGRVERGERNVTLLSMQKIAQALGCCISELIL